MIFETNGLPTLNISDVGVSEVMPYSPELSNGMNILLKSVDVKNVLSYSYSASSKIASKMVRTFMNDTKSPDFQSLISVLPCSPVALQYFPLSIIPTFTSPENSPPEFDVVTFAFVSAWSKADKSRSDNNKSPRSRHRSIASPKNTIRYSGFCL